MKKITLLSFLLIGFSMSGYAQKWIAEHYMERTQVSTKIGNSVGVIFPVNIEVGVFYQRNSDILIFQEKKLPKLYEKNFKGVYFGYPVIEAHGVDLDFKVRVGVTNLGFIITPSMHAYVEPVKNIRLGLGMGMRLFRPTFQSSIAIIL